ncbi:MAG: hypothetical protein H0U73_01620 [Tatlockia sp.]|nr:hypothetical protein [Tatlockia sp.]
MSTLLVHEIDPPWYERLFLGTSYRNSYLWGSQSYYKSTIEIWVQNKQFEAENYAEVVELSWYHRLLNWCIIASGLQWKFNSSDLNDDELFAKLREHEGIEEGSREPRPANIANEPTSSLKIETPPIREKHSVAKLLSSPNIILKRMTKAVDPERVVAPENVNSTTPAHMQHWLTSLSLNQAVDHRHQHRVQQEQNINANVEILALQRIQETTKWTDDSLLNKFEIAVNSLEALKYKASKEWIEALNRACKNEWNAAKAGKSYKFSPHQLLISDTALDMLLKAKGHVRSALYNLDFDSLPLGFFIDKNTEANLFTLKYNEKYRLHQLATLRDAAVRLDVNNPASDFHLDSTELTCSVTKNDLLQTLSERNIHLKQRHLDFLEKLDCETHSVKFRKEDSHTETKAYAFRALQVMAEAIYPLPRENFLIEGKQDPYLSEFIDILDGFSKINTAQLTGTTSFSHYENTSTTSYLNKFILNYLKGITNGKEYYSEEERDALKRYATLNRNEFTWLMNIESATERYNLNFSETSKGLFYFFDYFSGLGVPVPDYRTSNVGASSLGGFIELKHILDCISLAGNGKNILAKQFQAEYTSNIPDSYDLAKAALREGYAFVHESMLFGYGGGDSFFNYDHSSFDLHIVTRDEFKQAGYGYTTMNGLKDTIYFRALYLRFISYNVDPQYFKEAINKWVTVTGTGLTCHANSFTNGINNLEVLNTALHNHWKELQLYALSLPSIMAANKEQSSKKTTNDVPEAFINQKEALFQSEKEYPQEHINFLFKKINLSEALAQEISASIHQINTLTKPYAEMSEENLQQALSSAKKSSLEERIAILRETHCRLTCSQSKANPPQGEWLRLEQLVSVLLAMKEECLLQIDTGEGKTFILQLIALLKALDGEKVNVLTHNESLALNAGDKIKRLAYFVGIKTAKKTDDASSIIDADIVYIDISAAVINDLLAKQSLDNRPLPGKRKASVAIIDEVDNIVIDIHANTTMQISQGNEESDKDLEQFLYLLNSIVRTELPERRELTEIDMQRSFIRNQLDEELTNNLFYKTQCSKDHDLDKYIRAAINAATLIRDTHYVVETDDLVINEVTITRKVVHIMHKDTTGRADKISQWGEGIHQCVAAYEKQHNDPTMIIPGISKVLAEGDIETYLNESYSSHIGVTATIGNEKIRDKIDEIIKAKLNIVIPRAIRPLGIEASWPLKQGQPEYNRSYRFSPIYKDSESQHYATLLEAIQNIQDNNQSCIIFWNTISDCDEFFAFLKQNRISTQTIQILDDTHDEEKAHKTHSFRPSEATVISRANEPKMITLTTAAGSRGTDFDDINIGILAKPNLGRVTEQKAGRIARNGQFGQVYEIYNANDLDKSIKNEALNSEADNKNNPMGHRSRILAHEIKKEEQTLKAIEQRGSKRSIFKAVDKEVENNSLEEIANLKKPK